MEKSPKRGVTKTQSPWGLLDEVETKQKMRRVVTDCFVASWGSFESSARLYAEGGAALCK